MVGLESQGASLGISVSNQSLPGLAMALSHVATWSAEDGAGLSGRLTERDVPVVCGESVLRG